MHSKLIQDWNIIDNLDEALIEILNQTYFSFDFSCPILNIAPGIKLKSPQVITWQKYSFIHW